MESMDDIFLNAQQLASAEEQAASLAKACGGDVELRRRIEAMLRDAAGAENFFRGEELVGFGGDERLTEGPGSVIGSYKLLQKIGEGGMGVVYMAEATLSVPILASPSRHPAASRNGFLHLVVFRLRPGRPEE
jgi:hypothetical protein